MKPAAAAGPSACGTRGTSGGSGSGDGAHTGMPCGASGSGPWALELACGTGSSCAYMARVMEGSRVVGVDLVQGAVEEARRRVDASSVSATCSFMQASNTFEAGEEAASTVSGCMDSIPAHAGATARPTACGIVAVLNFPEGC